MAEPVPHYEPESERRNPERVSRRWRGPAPQGDIVIDDSFCADCQKWLSEHGKCSACGHYDCDCICEFLRDEWPTHPSNPDFAAPVHREEGEGT